MKKISLILLIPFLLSCSIEDSSSDYYTPSISMSRSESWSYSQSKDFYIVDEDLATLNISGDLAGKNLYYATVNTSSSQISSSYVKYLNENFSRNIESSSEYKNISREYDFSSSFNPDSFYLKWKADIEGFSPSFSRTIDNPARRNIPVRQITSYVDGETSKNIYALTEENNFERKSATLQAHNDVCNVWVVNSYFTNGSSADGKINSQTAERIASAFEEMYPIIRYVYGNESDSVYYSPGLFSGWEIKDMEYLSDTGTKVNIVIYDLFSDGESGATLGFFNGMDYYPNSDDFKLINNTNYDIGSYSNEGKYFYIDSYMAISRPDEIISTLAHEFQHMIHFGRKTMNNLDSDTSFNEMMSMLCEDMMQEYLNIDNSHSPKGRLLDFLIGYYTLGLRDFDSENNAGISYANSYAFGAWLCRQYGGANLIKEMMSNGKSNNECIVAAVNSINHSNFTFNELFSQFIKACYGKDDSYTFNQDAQTSIRYTAGGVNYQYPMSSINFWDESVFSLYNLSTNANSGRTFREILIAICGGDDSLLDSNYNYLGPAVFSNSAIADIPSRYGMILKRVKTFPAGTRNYKASFSSRSGYTKEGMKLFFFIK